MAEENKRSEAPTEGLTAISAKLPPNLLKMIGYPGSARYVGLYYLGSKATWDDGIASTTFPFFSVYQPLIDHPAISIHLMDMDLGSDDSYATHALLCDREEERLFAGEMNVIRRVLTNQFPAELDEDLIAQYQKMFRPADSLEQMQSLGMFEILLRPCNAMQAETEELLQFLDQFITRELVERYIGMLNAKDYRAWLPLNYINNRFGSGQQQRAEV